MASRGAVLRGALSIPGAAARPTAAPQGSNASSGGSFAQLAASYAPSTGQISPLAAQLANEGGYARSYGSFLPRPPEDFTQGAFSPFSPILPVPVDQPPEGADRPEPRRWQYTPGYDLPVGQPGQEGLKLVGFDTLARLAEVYSVARACVEHRKNQIRGIEWDIVPTPEAAKAYQGSPSQLADFGKRRAKALKFFKRPDRDYFSYATWISAVLEEVLVYDALSVLIRPVWGKGRGKGVLGSDLESLMLVHGPTIRPLIDLHGATPRPPAVAYQQYLYGVPRSDLMAMIFQQDIEDSGLTGQEVAAFKGDQLLYLPMITRAQTPYGFPPIERALIPIMTGLQKQGYQYDFFGESSVPHSYVIPGDTAMTPNQLRELQDALNAIAGDPAWKQKIIVLPPGSKVDPVRPLQTADQLDEIVMSQVCMAFGILPMELGILPRVSTTASPGAANQMAKMTQNQSEDTGSTPLLKYLADIFNVILQEVCDQDDMMFTFEGLQQEEDQDALTGVLVQQFQNGMRTLDECRQELNLQPYGLEETSEPLLVTPTGVTPISTAVQSAEVAAQQQQSQAQLTAEQAAALRAQAGGAGQQPAPGQQPQQQNQPDESKATPAAGAEGRQPRPRPATASASQTSVRPGRVAAQAAAQESASSAKSAAPAVLHKGAEAELAALTRHLRKGRAISTWEPRYITERALADIAKSMAEGMTPEQAVDGASTRLLTVTLEKAESRWAGWLRDSQLAARYAPLISSAFAAALREAGEFIGKLVSGAVRVTFTWAAQHISELIAAALRRVLHPLWTEGWALGDRSAEAVLTGSAVDWQDWEPGDPEAAAQVAESPGLQQLLEQWGVNVIQAVSETNLESLASVIASALQRGLPAAAITQEIAGFLQVPQRADLIAQTEISRAVSAATLYRYAAAGVDRKEWLVAPDERVCKICRANEADGAIPTSQAFSDGKLAPPAHPRCRCTTIPASFGNADFTEMRSQPLPGFRQVPAQRAPETVKTFNPAEPRNAHGEWAHISADAEHELSTFSESEQKRFRKLSASANDAIARSAPMEAYHHTYKALTPHVEHSPALNAHVSDLFRGAERPSIRDHTPLPSPPRMTDDVSVPFGKLTPVDKLEIRMYTRPMIDNFNDALRKNDDDFISRFRGDFVNLDKAISKSWARSDMTLYRGIAAPKEFLHEPGTEFTDAGYGSTTTDYKIADEFARARSGDVPSNWHGSLPVYSGTPLVMRIKVPAGFIMADGAPEVKEKIFPRSTRYRVIKSDARNGVIDVEVVT